MSRKKDIEDKYGVPIELNKYTGRNENGNIIVATYPVINEFVSMEQYESYLDQLVESIKRYLSESKRKFSKMTISFKFNSNDQLITMNYIRFIFNIIMWRPYLTFKIPVTKDDIFSPETFYNKKYEEFFNKFSELHRDKFTMAEFSESLFWTQVYMNKIVTNIGPLFGNSISVFDMLMMARKNKEIDAIINTEIDLDNYQVREVEEFLISQTERMFEILLNESDKNNFLKPFIRADVGVNKNQTRESYIHAGFKPDLDGNTIPLTTNTNLLTDGLKTPEAVFIDSKGGRKAAILGQGQWPLLRGNF